MSRSALLLVAIATAACAGTAPPPKSVASQALDDRVAAPGRASSKPDTSVKPDGDPAPVTEGDVTVASVRGMQVLVERVRGAEFSAAYLAIRGGVRNWSADRAGIEAVGLAAAIGGGTRTLSKEQLARRLASLGATLATRTRADFSEVTAVAPAASFDETFGILADVVLAPALPRSEIALALERAISDRRHEMEDGDGRLGVLELKAVFANHPYSARPEGTLETLGGLTPDAIAEHLAKLRETSRLLLVVVGDVDAGHVIGLARDAFADTPRGLYVQSPPVALRFERSEVIADTFPMATNYVGSFFVAPTWKEADHVAARVAIEVLSHRVWEEVRTKRNLSYAPWAVFRLWYRTPYAGFYVSTVDPDATMRVMMDEARRIQTDLVPADELAGQKAVFHTACEQAGETSSDETWQLALGELYADDWRFVRRYCDAVETVSAEQIRAVARKYMTAWRTVIVGDPSKLEPSIVHAR